jgi:hypothetical protein
LPVIDSGYISLGGKDAFKVLRGSSPSDPTQNLQIYSISGDKLYTISYLADRADYATYLPDVQKIVDTFGMLAT